MATEDVMWSAVQGRDRGFDGQFWFGVLTTGVFCRPSCSSRQPLRENVRFFEDVAAAERAGLRACKRCRPQEDFQTNRMHEMADYIRKHYADGLLLNELASRASLSTFHFQRSFKAAIGVTPKQFLDGCRVEALKGELREKRAVTDAIYEAGFGSSSRVYERLDTQLGMTPRQYRTGGEKVQISYAAGDSVLGRLMIGATDRGICFLQFGATDQEMADRLHGEFPAAVIQPMPEAMVGQFDEWMQQLKAHLGGERTRLELPLDLRATAFQLKVWRYLQEIPYGTVRSYSEVAADLGQPSAARAVARACGTNRVAVLVPCHRVIRGTGELAGYKWGLERKRELIDRERSAVAAR